MEIEHTHDVAPHEKQAGEIVTASRVKFHGKWLLTAVCVTVFVTAIVQFSKVGDDMPLSVKLAIRRMDSLPKTVTPEQAFEHLGFILPDDGLDSVMDGRGGYHWFRYDIGFGREFVIECIIYCPPGGSPHEPGRVRTLEFRRHRLNTQGEWRYQTISPVWKAEK